MGVIFWLPSRGLTSAGHWGGGGGHCGYVLRCAPQNDYGRSILGQEHHTNGDVIGKRQKI